MMGHLFNLSTEFEDASHIDIDKAFLPLWPVHMHSITLSTR